ncbi:hypothetical protein [Pseudomonas amygdali]|uniref:hypothetical protein n=1 Tax=Pseudomonas amygdali TaxID=47877 RepID=UPI000B07B8E8|nr:hypothetical protein [Pseudomonas amygdali]
MYKVRPQLKPLLDFIKKVADYGADGGLFGEAGSIPPQFEGKRSINPTGFKMGGA